MVNTEKDKYSKMTFYRFRFKVFLLTFILLFTFLFNLISFSYAQTCQGNDCLTEEDFINNPRNAFSNNANEAWNLIRQNPQAIYGGLNGNAIITQSAQDDPNNFLDVVSNNRDLLSIPQVREEVAKLAHRNVEVLNSNPQFRRDFLARFGVQDQGARIDKFQHGRRETTITTQSQRGQVEISLSMLNGGRINSDGSVTLESGIEIHSGTVSITNSNLDLRRGGIIRVPNYEGFISSSSRLGVIHNSQRNSFQLSGTNMQLSDSRGVSRVSGAYTLLPNNQVILGGAGTRSSTIEYLNEQGEVLENVRVTQQTLIRTNRGCEGTEISCIYRSGGSVEINPRGNNRINYNYNYKPEVDFTVLQVIDNSRVIVNVPTDSRNAEFTIGRTASIRGSLGHNSNFNLAYSVEGRNGRPVQITDYVIRNGRFYSIYTGNELPQHALALECRVGERCGSHGLTMTTYGTFCDSRNVCRNSHGVRVDETGTHFINSNGHIIGQVGRDRLNPYLLDRDLRDIWIPGVGYEFTPSTRGRAARRDDMFDGRIPVFSSDVVPPNFCARYVRLAGERLFGTNFVAANAWDMHRHHQATFRFDDQRRRAGSISQQELNYFTGQARNAFQSGQINQGTAIRFWNPNSRWRGNDVTHVALVLGTNAQGEVLIGHQYGSRYYQETLPQMMARTNNRPRDILVS